MARQSVGGAYRNSYERGRDNFRGHGRGGMGPPGRGQGVQKPPPLMARLMPPPFGMRRPILPEHSALLPRIDFRRMSIGPPVPGLSHGMPRGRGRVPFVPVPRGRGLRPLLRRGGMIPRGRGSLLPPPPIAGPLLPAPVMFRPPGPLLRPPLMRGRGYYRGRGPSGFLATRRGRLGRGRGGKEKVSESPSGEMNKPWVTEVMKNEILKKHKLHQKAKKARTKEDWEIFKEHRNKVTTMLREAKLEYIGAHPEEDVDKILAEADSTFSTKEATATSDGDDSSSPKLEEGPEPMEEGVGGALDGTSPDPEAETERA